MKKFIFILLLITAITHNLVAQIQGNVRCADGTPAQYATVSVYKDSNTLSNPVSYAVTAKNGHFTMNVQPKAGWWIAVRCIGYKEYRQELDKDNNGIDIVLEIDEGNNLDEVTVKSTYTGIRISGDTIAFDTEHFKTGDEETVSDVLKKLPGMDVSDNGEVSFGGKNVDKVLIDGKDMFSSGSDGVINTLSADAVTGAEILKNYKTGNLVDDYRSHDLTAVNIKTNGKQRLSGKVYLAGGADKKFKCNTDVLYMGDKAFFTSILSANNTGEELFSFTDYIKNIIGLDNILSSGGRSLNLSDEELTMVMPPQNVYKSNNGLWSLSGTYRPSSVFKIQGSVIMNGAEYDAESLSEQLYRTLDITNRHYGWNDNRNKFFTANLRETYNPGSRTEISNLTQISVTALNTEDSLNESGLTDMFAEQNSVLKKISFKEEAALNVKVGEGLVSAHVLINNIHRNYSYDLITDNNILPVDYSLTAMSDYFLMFRRKINNMSFSPDLTFAYPVTNNLKMQITLLMNYNENKFSYDDFTVNADENMKWHDYSADIVISRNQGLFRFSAGAELRNTNWRTSIADMSKGSSTDIFPKVRVTLHFNTSHELSLSANMGKNPIETEYLLRNSMISGYSSMHKGSVIKNPFTESKNINLRYNIFNMYYNTMFFFDMGISDNDVTRSHTLQDSSIVTQTYYDNDGHNLSRYFNSSLSQGIGSLPLDAKLSFSASKSKSKTSLNEQQDEINSSNYRISVNIVSRMKSLFNFELGGYYSNSEYTYKISSFSNNMSSKGCNAGLICVYKNFRGNIRYTFTYLDNETFGRNYNNLGFRLEYKIKKWRIHIQGSNIFNIADMDWVSISANELYTSSTVYKKIPGYILGGITYRF